MKNLLAATAFLATPPLASLDVEGRDVAVRELPTPSRCRDDPSAFAVEDDILAKMGIARPVRPVFPLKAAEGAE